MQIALKLGHGHHIVEVHAEAGRHRIRLEGHEHQVEVHPLHGSTLVVIIDGQRHRLDLVHHGRERLVAIAGETYRFEPESAVGGGHQVESVALPEVTAPMPGKITEILVKAGDRVDAGGGLLVLEAMKMENRLVADAAGTVTEVRVAAGDLVDGGQVLVVLSYD